MATTLTSSYQYIGRSNAVSCPSGWKYYILLYAKTSPNTTAGTHTVSVKQYLACINDSTFHNWSTTGYVKVAGTNAFSWEKDKVPLSSWGSSASLAVGGYTYKRHTLLKEGSVVVNTGFGAVKTVTLSSYWKMESSNSAGWFPYKTPAELSVDVSLSAIAGASTPTVSASSVQMGKTLTITTNRLSSNFTHTLYYTFGGTKTTMATSVGASYTWTIPDLAAKCNNATSGKCTITCDTYNGSTKIGSKTVSVTLTVQSATTPTFSASSVNMGSAVTIKTARSSSNFTHKLTYSFSGATGTIASSGVTTSKSWTPPYSLATKIPSATSGTCTVTCTTYNGTASVGSKTATITLKVPDNSTTKPTISATLSAVNEFSSLYVQNRSKVKATITASSTYSAVKTYKMKVNGKTVSGTSNALTSATLSSSGTLTVTCTVVDARGYSNSVSKSINVVSYTTPKLTPVSGEKAVVCERCLSDGTISASGTYLKIRAKNSYSSVSSKNSGSIQWRYKTSSASSYGTWATLTTSNTYDDKVSGITLDKKTAYSIQIQAIDAVSGDGGAHKVIFNVPSDEVTLHLKDGGKAAGFGEYAGEDKSLLINSEWNVFGRVAGLGKCREVVPEGADLNQYLNIGEYSIPSNKAASTLVNCPSEKAGRLRVSSMIGDGRSGADGVAYTYLLQEYFTFDGYYRYYRMASTAATANVWSYNAWWCDSSTYWQDLGLNTDAVSKPEASWSLSRAPYNCAYRVENENHVYVSFNCKFSWSGATIRVNKNVIPEKYRPARHVYAFAAISSKRIARIHVTSGGIVNIEWVQDMSASSATTSGSSTYIDGYIDYWV